MTFIIRRARHADAEGIIQAHIASITEICSQHYTPEQIEAWVGRKVRPELWCQIMDRDFVWVIEHQNKITGFGHLALMSETAGEILGLYFIPAAINKGLGRSIFSEMLKLSREYNLKKLSLLSTITAKSFYESLGFYQSGGDDSIEMRGVAIPCFPMEFLVD